MKQYPAQLRPQFFGHVIGPIGHHCIAQATPESEYWLTSNLENPLTFGNWFPSFKETDLKTSTVALSELLKGMRAAVSFSNSNVQNVTEFPRTPAQVKLMNTLQKGNGVQSGKRHLWYKNRDGSYVVKRESAFTVESNSVLRALNLVVTRTKGLNVSTIDQLAALALRPELPTVLRPLMAGGSAFDTLIQTAADLRIHPLFDDFCNREKPVAFFDGNVIVPNEEILRIARDYNRYLNDPMNQIVDEETIGGNSAGCPVKNLRFRQHTPLLDSLGASLTDEQVSILTSGPNPTAVAVTSSANGREGSQSFVVVRDAISETLQMVARQLDGVIDTFDRELCESPDNEYLLGNVGLLVGRPFVAGNLREAIEGTSKALPALELKTRTLV